MASLTNYYLIEAIWQNKYLLIGYSNKIFLFIPPLNCTDNHQKFKNLPYFIGKSCLWILKQWQSNILVLYLCA